jgi:hypothetical protein
LREPPNRRLKLTAPASVGAEDQARSVSGYVEH